MVIRARGGARPRMVGFMSTPDMLPWVLPQVRQLLGQQGHAWLLEGASGLGQFDLALALAGAWLCEQAGRTEHPEPACGHCASCHALSVHTHPDVLVLLSEVTALALGWPLDEKAQKELDDKKRKPSKDIRVEAMRSAIDFAQRTDSRGQGKVIVIFPAERMNTVTANALLKTLEEPASGVRFVLATEAADKLLPTVRSRCLSHPMAWPDADLCLAWLCQTRNLPATDAPTLLRAAGGRPMDALALFEAGWRAQAWSQFPKRLLHGDPSSFAAESPQALINSLQKLCHDLMCRLSGAPPRYFLLDELAHVPTQVNWTDLAAWAKSLQQARRTADHPFNAGLMIEALLTQARRTLACSGSPAFRHS